jgi:hypothetical protein
VILSISAEKGAEVSAFRAPSSAERALGDTYRPIVPMAFFEDIINVDSLGPQPLAEDPGIGPRK